MIFKVHYGLWYGGLVGIMPFMFNYALTYPGATATQHGTLYTILPFIALLAKPTVCSYADKYHVHKQALIFFIMTTIIGYGSLAVYPFFPDLVENHKSLLWALYCIAALIGNTSMCIVNSLGDTLAINSCKRNNCTYGEYRLWGPIGFGIMGSLWGFANKFPQLPQFTPGILTLILIHILNVIFLVSWKDQDEFKILKIESQPTTTNPTTYGSTNHDDVDDGPDIELNKSDNEINDRGDNLIDDDEVKRNVSGQGGRKQNISRLQLFCLLCKTNYSMLGYILLFTLCGVLTSIHWQFFFGYLSTLAQNQNQDFSYVTTLALPVQSLGGELVFFFFSGKILAKLGPSLTLTFCLFSFAARYLAYAFVIPIVNLYCVLLVELLQGPAFGLMYCVLTHQAQYYSSRVDDIVTKNSLGSRYKNSLNATLQGVIGASFEGLGLGLGAIVGGLAYDVAPKLMWQIAGFSAFVAGVILLAINIICILSRQRSLM